ncbi:MAG: bifunctional phosphopantothenoylcysteine decarboxylase/phosphopantothenate--cysteine ligase CoaBC [Candidatus Eisenbacteria bacterium]|nr:bifunctional phosphopantothenoylcysteine decarboxylase/phosphopantothenate--cysteine ligase CoaBC [Candidatus Eisenbacteria bacterium]
MAERRTLADCSVTLGVTGSIAAYKSVEILRLLQRLGIAVRVAMTRSGAELVSPRTFAELCGQPAAVEMFPHPAPAAPEMAHLNLSEGDLLLVAPATANILGKAASGIADDLLSATILATRAPVLFAPAMNTRMWENPVLKEKVAYLKEKGYLFVGPTTGDLACGEYGSGRMLSPREIVDAALKVLLSKTDGVTVLVTAGPTEEAVDPVRVFSNRSSGKMGCRIAAAARDRGHNVILVAGPLRCEAPIGIERIDVATAAEMEGAVKRLEERAEIMVMSAAVADYRPSRTHEEKIPSGRKSLALELTPTTDILAAVGPERARRGALTVGFALEMGPDSEKRARAKLEAKGCDLLVLNDATQAHSVFGGDTTKATLLFKDGRIEPLPLLPKAQAAREIILRIEALRGYTNASNDAD